MSTLAEFMILSGADNHAPMLKNHLYDSYKSIMELYMQNREHERMILKSVEHGPLIWPTIEENGVTRTMKYEELSATEKIQADFPVFKQGDDHIDVINKMMLFLSTFVSSFFHTTNNQLRNSSNLRQQETIHDRRVTVQPVQGRQSSFAAGTSRQGLTSQEHDSGQQRVVKCFNCQGEGSGKVLNEEELEFLADPIVVEGLATQIVITYNAAYQVNNLDAYDSDCDDFSTAK
nr:hypothetical protein [Tanacetum cinerariifolium]